MAKASKVTKVQQAPESSAAGDGESDTRKKVSKRSFLTANGGEAEKMEESAGARYTLLGEGGGDFDYVYGQNPTADKFYANFGFHTKIGNVANTVLNNKEDPGTPADAAGAIKEFMDGVTNGVWAERTGGVGAKIDLDALAGAVVAAAESKGRSDLDVREVREKLESDKALVRKVRQVPDIAAEYNKRVGKVVSLDEAMASF